MNKLTQFRLLVLSSLAVVMAWAGIVTAQDNRIPTSWGTMSVNVIETYGNNNTRPFRGAKVRVDLKNAKDPKTIAILDSLRRLYPVLRQPPWNPTRGGRFSPLPPSSLVGPYIVTVDPKPNDRKKEYICEEQNKKDSREVRLATGTRRLTFNFKCKKADAVNEFTRRKKGGYDLTVKVEQDAAPRGYGLWVHLYDKDGNRIKKVRTGGSAEAKFRAIDPAYNPYKIQVYAMNKLLFEDHYKMPDTNATYTADLDKTTKK